jgi:hypothetical protein
MTQDKFLEKFPVPLPNGDHGWTGWLYRTWRPQGRQLLIRARPTPALPGDPMGLTLFDSGEQYDMANAANGMELWLDAITAAMNPVVDQAAAVALGVLKARQLNLSSVPTSALRAELERRETEDTQVLNVLIAN